MTELILPNDFASNTWPQTGARTSPLSPMTDAKLALVKPPLVTVRSLLNEGVFSAVRTYNSFEPTDSDRAFREVQ